MTYINGQGITLAQAFAHGSSSTASSVTVTATGQRLTYYGTLQDPSTLTLELSDGLGNVTSHIYGGSDLTIVKDQVGVYYASVLLTSNGLWRVRWVADSSSVVAQIYDSTFDVVEGNF